MFALCRRVLFLNQPLAEFPTVALEPCQERRAVTGLLPATEPLHEDGHNLLFGGPKTDLGVI